MRAARALTSPGVRAAQGRYLLEGVDLVMQALAGGARVLDLFVVDRPPGAVPDAMAELALSRDVPLHCVTPGILFKIAGVGYDNGLTCLAVVERKPLPEDRLPTGADAWLAVGESIQDPRNVGVLVRTADAAGCEALILSADSEDPYSRAAVRSSTGSILRLPIHLAQDLPALLRRLRARGVRVVATSAHADRLLWDVPLSGPVALVFGNETHGVSPAVYSEADASARIPLLGGAHSLNVAVAAGIVLFEGVRQRSAAAREPVSISSA